MHVITPEAKSESAKVPEDVPVTTIETDVVTTEPAAAGVASIADVSATEQTSIVSATKALAAAKASRPKWWRIAAGVLGAIVLVRLLPLSHMANSPSMETDLYVTRDDAVVGAQLRLKAQKL